MMFRTWGRVSVFALLASFCMLTVAAEKKSTRSSKASSASSKTAVASTKVAKDKTAQRSGRLPRHFAALVDEKQRKEIYQIQVSYREEIEELEAALAELEMAQLSDIEKVLTSTQRKKLSTLRKSGGAGSSSKSAAKSRSASTRKTSAKSGSTKSRSASTKKTPAKSASTKSRKSSSKK